MTRYDIIAGRIWSAVIGTIIYPALILGWVLAGLPDRNDTGSWVPLIFGHVIAFWVTVAIIYFFRKKI